MPVEFLGVGILELLVVLVLALIVAGPQRMIAWSYTLGRWINLIRRLWGQTAVALQQELDAAGVDVQVPKDIPTRDDLQREVGRVVNKYGAPLSEPLNEVKGDLASITRTAASVDEELTENAAKTQSAIAGLKSTRPTKPITSAVPRPVQGGGHKLAELGKTAPAAAPDLGTWTEADAAPPTFGTWSN